MLNCIALDDEPMALDVIKAFCEQTPFLNLSHCFTQSSLARKHLQKFPVDLIFLDIEMPDINGIDFYKSLKQVPMVIFSTAHSQFAVDGFDVNAIDYLLKPVEFSRFNTACEKALELFELKKSKPLYKQSFLFVRSEYALVKILFDDILYLETMDDYIKIHTSSSKGAILTLSSLSKILEKLPTDNFVRIHRSYAVSVLKIDTVRKNTICIDHRELPLGNSFKKQFIEKYT